MSDTEKKECLEMRNISTWNAMHRRCAQRLYYMALKEYNSKLTKEQKISLNFLRKKYKKQLSQTVIKF